MFGLVSVISLLPILYPVTPITLPELITRRFQAKITPQLVDGQGIASERIRRTPLQMLIQRRPLVGVAVLGDDRVVHHFERNLSHRQCEYALREDDGKQTISTR